ncbi:MAG: ribosome silencing factor [Methylococcaceae bacterium]|jgi:ribosome-associated protein
MQTEALLALVEGELNERKAINMTVLDVRGKTSFTDYMIVVTGTSNRHLKALCDYVEMKVKASGVMPLGMEGDITSDWVLLDLGDVIVHAMTQQTRDLYQLERLWTVGDPIVQEA